MKRIEYTNTRPLLADGKRDPAGLGLSLSIGSVAGDIEYRLARPDDANSGIECHFVFRAVDGNGFEYVSLLGGMHFWPGNHGQVMSRCEYFEADTEIKSYLDWREGYNLTVDDGRKIEGFLKYTPIFYAFCPRKDRLLMRARLGVAGNPKREEAEWQTFFYELSVDIALWLPVARAPKLFNVTALPQDMPYSVVEVHR